MTLALKTMKNSLKRLNINKNFKKSKIFNTILLYVKNKKIEFLEVSESRVLIFCSLAIVFGKLEKTRKTRAREYSHLGVKYVSEQVCDANEVVPRGTEG